MGAIRITGLNEFTRNLRKLDREVPKAMRVALNDAADIVLDYARPHIPRRSGKAAASLRAASTTRAVRVRAGGAKAPYYPWLDFGGRVGRKKRTKRPYIREGRYLYPALSAKREQFEAAVRRALLGAAKDAGFEVDRGR